MADETKESQETQPEDPILFSKRMLEAKGIPGERPEETSETDYNTSILMGRQELSDAERVFEQQVPDATEAQKQQFVEAVVQGNLTNEVAAITAGVRTTLEKAEKKDGPKELKMKKQVEDGGSGDETKRDRVGPMSLQDAINVAADSV